jgi:hypothetical protein
MSTATRSRIGDADFPSRHGCYVVWEEGSERPLYVGEAVTQTIRRRWQGQHLRPRSGGSAPRRSLGVYLGLVERKLSVGRDGRYYPRPVEEQITRFLEDCEIEFAYPESGETISELQARLIRDLDPRLNVRR